MERTETPSPPTGRSSLTSAFAHPDKPRALLARLNRGLRLALSATLALALNSGAFADEPADYKSGDASLTRTDPSRGNICFGGLEHGKLIPPDDEIENPFRQTTLSACSADGGSPTFLPELKPKVPDGILS
ncbi:MAG: hypothetical protein F4X31_02285, partial [Gammaproteobacteria bacterium]|nr:hypothetical protein [Gammaproteobacteria bacterium]MYF51993.1 hypothetical protein [Gammaproteobacteria bacterium]